MKYLNEIWFSNRLTKSSKFSKPITLLFILTLFFSCKNVPSENQNQIKEESKKYSPISIKGLQNRSYQANLKFERKLQSSENWTADLWSYHSDSLKIYTLINTPKSTAPEKGFPILIFGHGFHPEPKKYGISNKTGKDWRPGDYYRGIPESYAERGFLTVTPDYRGHNISDGFEYTKTSYLASTYYAIDVLHLIGGLSNLENVNLKEIYYMGHSMGGDVGLKMLLATNKIKAASLWSAVSASTPEQAIYYGKWNDEHWDSIAPSSMKNYMTRLDTTLQHLGFEHEIASGDPIHFLNEISIPIIIHHATKETSVPYRWSESLAAKLYELNKPFEFYSYESEHHLFKDENRVKAVERDIRFFKNIK